MATRRPDPAAASDEARQNGLIVWAGSLTLHATALAFADRGVLLVGKSGSGKSDLALRAVAAAAQFAALGLPAARLIADDMVLASTVDGYLTAGDRPSLHGLLEVRGVGIVALATDLIVPKFNTVRVALIVELVAPGAVERMPEPRTIVVRGNAAPFRQVTLPLVALAPFEPSAPLKLGLALATLP